MILVQNSCQIITIKSCLGNNTQGEIWILVHRNMYLPSLSVWWYRIAQESRGEAKGYNSEIWHWSQHLRAPSLFLTRSSLFFVNKMQVICCLWSSVTKLQFCYLLMISSFFFFFKSTYGYMCFFFFFIPLAQKWGRKTKVLLGSVRSAYHKSDLTDIFFLKRMNIHPLSVEGPWYLYGQCDLSPYPLRLGVQHRKLRSCSSP